MHTCFAHNTNCARTMLKKYYKRCLKIISFKPQICGRVEIKCSLTNWQSKDKMHNNPIINTKTPQTLIYTHTNIHYINGGDVQRKNVVNNVDKSSLWAP